MSFLTAENIREVREIGYSIVRGVLAPDQAADLRQRLATLVAQQRDTADEMSKIDDYMVHNQSVNINSFFQKSIRLAMS